MPEVEATLLHIALCHSIVIDQRTGKLNSSSPDELALVEGAQKLGFSLKCRDVNGLVTVERLRDGA